MFRKRVFFNSPLRQNAVKRVVIAAGGMALVLAIFGLAFTSCKKNHPNPKATLQSISVTEGSYKSTYFVGEEANWEGIQVTALYSNTNTKPVPFEELEITGFNSSELGVVEITVQWIGKGEPGKCVFAIEVVENLPPPPPPPPEDVLVSITLTNNPDKRVYYEKIDETVIKDGLLLTASYSISGDRALVEETDYSLGGLDLSDPDFEAGSKAIPISYALAGAGELESKPDQFTVTTKKVLSISLSPTTKKYVRGVAIADIMTDLNAVTVTAHYGEDDSKTVPRIHDGSTSTIDVGANGTYDVTYRFAGKTAIFKVVIYAPLKTGGTGDDAAIRLNRTSIELKPGATFELDILTNPADTTDVVTATWESSNPEIATVDENGVVTAIKAGSVTITATLKVNDAEPGEGLPKTLTCSVIVKEPQPVGISWSEIMKPDVTITGPVLSLTGTNSAEVEVTGVEATAYKWYVNNVLQSSTTNKCTVTATNDHIGRISLRVEVLVGGNWYNKTVTFTVGL